MYISNKHTLTIETATTGEQEMTIPCYYKVGIDCLDVFYNGNRLVKDLHYQEVGDNNTLSNKIKIGNDDYTIDVGDVFEFVVRTYYSETEAVDSIDAIQAEIGTLNNLDTTSKTNLVSAVNEIVTNLSKTMKTFTVNTNDNKFNDVRQIIGDEAKDLVPYLITNYPLNDGNFIHNGAAHTILGMQYGDFKYGSQLSLSLNGIKFRTLFNEEWNEWQNIGKTGNVFDLVTDFNNLVIPGTYIYGGQTITNQPNNFGIVEVLSADIFLLQRVTGANSIASRISYDSGVNWSIWKYANLT